MIKITIEGKQREGKTTIAHAIAQALAASINPHEKYRYGLTCKIIDSENEETIVCAKYKRDDSEIDVLIETKQGDA